MSNKVAALLGKQSETGRVFQGAPTRLMAKAGLASAAGAADEIK
jgi:hypothetical protein